MHVLMPFPFEVKGKHPQAHSRPWAMGRGGEPGAEQLVGSSPGPQDPFHLPSRRAERQRASMTKQDCCLIIQ